MAIEFSGSSENVTVTSISEAGNWTVAFNVKRTASGNNLYYAFGPGPGSTGLSVGGIYSAPDNEMVFYDGTNVLFGDSALGQDTWYHVGLVNAASTYTFYLNGVADGGGAADDVDIDNTMIIGERSDLVGGTEFKGLLANMAIWGTDLSAAEMAQVAAGGGFPVLWMPLTVDPANLTAYWPMMDKAAGTTVTNGSMRDVSVNGNHSASQENTPTFEAALISTLGAGPISVITAAAAAVGHPTMRRWGGVPHMTPGPVLAGRSW